MRFATQPHVDQIGRCVVEGIVAKSSKRQPAALREMQKSGWGGQTLGPPQLFLRIPVEKKQTVWF